MHHFGRPKYKVVMFVSEERDNIMYVGILTTKISMSDFTQDSTNDCMAFTIYYLDFVGAIMVQTTFRFSSSI